MKGLTKLLKHLKTIRIHRKYVRKACFKMGLYWQGLVHDLSKYSIAELKIAKYYDGIRSPHQVCRETIGYSPSWIHHYHINKHHYSHWWDEDEFGKIIPIKMPFKYVIESFCDMIGAGKAYMADNWTVAAPSAYYQKCCKDKRIMNKESIALLENLLNSLLLIGNEDDFYKWYREVKKELKNKYEKRG